LPAAHFLSQVVSAAHFFSTNILAVGRWVPLSCLVYRFVDMEMIRIQILSDHNDTIRKKQHWRKCQITNPCQSKAREIQIAQHQFNSKTDYKNQRVTSTSQLLGLCLFFSVSTLFLRVSS